jgi:hypothetical protein
VDDDQGVVAEEGVGAAGEGQVVLDVGGGLGEIHALEVDAECDALVYGRVRPLAQAAAEGGLGDEQEGGGGAAVHAGAVVAEHAQVLELVGLEEVTLLDHDEHPAPAFGLSGSEGLGGLREDSSSLPMRSRILSSCRKGSSARQGTRSG